MKIKSFFKRKPDHPDADPLAKEKVKNRNPFLAAREEHDDRSLRMAKIAHAWKGFAFILLSANIVLALCIGYIGSQSKIRPYLVVVDKVNYDVRVGAAAEEIRLSDAMMKGIVQKQVRELIVGMRTVIADRTAQKAVMSEAYAKIASGSGAAKFLGDWYQMRDPFKYGENFTIGVEIRTALPLSDKVWQVEWIETERNLAGEVARQTHWKANVTYVLNPPESEKEIYRNPIGFYATQINWAQQ